jgi:hypothetical protein
MRKNLLISLIAFFIFTPLYPIDHLFNFPESSLEGKVEYEKKRVLCILAFRNLRNSNLTYLENGIAEVVYSSLLDFKFVYDEKPLEEIVVHPYNTSKTISPKTNFNPKFIPLEKKLITEIEEGFHKTSKLGCSYILQGEFEETGRDSLKINFELLNRKDGQKEIFSLNTSIRRAFQEIQANSTEFKKRLLKEVRAGLKIVNLEEGAFVYIDEEYAGKTPFEKLDLIPGRHKVLVLKQGYQRKEFEVNLEKDKILSYSIQLKKELLEGKISVDSNPRGAEVFLGGSSLGFTPIENVSVPVGQNRLRLSLENHVDHFQGVEIEKDKPVRFIINLQEGDTEIYYKNRLKLFQDYTYFDFSLFSFYGSLVFYASYMYAGMRSSLVQDKLQSFVKYTDFTMLQTIQTTVEKSNTGASDLGNYQALVATELFYQQSQVNKTMVHVRRYESIQQLSILGAGAMLIGAGLFYFLGIESQAIEFGFQPKTYLQDKPEAYFKLSFIF